MSSQRCCREWSFALDTGMIKQLKKENSLHQTGFVFEDVAEVAKFCPWCGSVKVWSRVVGLPENDPSKFPLD